MIYNRIYLKHVGPHRTSVKQQLFRRLPKLANYVSPLYTEGEKYRFTSHRSFLCHISFVSVRSVLFLSCRRSNTRRWHNVGLLLAHCLRRWANISPVLGYHVVFDATLNVGQRHRLTMVEWILANTGDAGPTFSKHWGGVGLDCLTRSSANRSVEPVLVLCWASVAEGGQNLVQHWVNVSCLLGVLTGHICVFHITGCEDNKTVAQLITPKDDLVTVDHLPDSKSWHSEVSGVVNLAGEDAVDIKKTGSTTSKYIVSTCLLSRGSI